MVIENHRDTISRLVYSVCGLIKLILLVSVMHEIKIPIPIANIVKARNNVASPQNTDCKSSQVV